LEEDVDHRFSGAFSLSVAVAQSEAAAYPEKGRTITMLNGSGVGGASDLFSRLLARCMEKVFVEHGLKSSISPAPELSMRCRP